MTTIQYITTVQAKPYGTITDYKYSPTGQYLAVADSQGYVQIFTKKQGKSQTYVKISEFRADEGSIWSIAWADPTKYGNIIGIGSFKNKVAIYQQNNNTWKQIAYHDLHHASVNWVEFAQYGLKLYAGSSDGQISLLQLQHKSWKIHAFSTGEAAIAVIALQDAPLGQNITQQNVQKFYPKIASVTKDQKIKIWCHDSQKQSPQQGGQKKSKSANKSGYYLLKQITTQKQTIKNILWRPSWGSTQHISSQISLLACSQQGNVKSYVLNLNDAGSDKIKTIMSTQNQVTKICQSLTGNLLTVSTINKNIQQTYVYEEIGQNEWKIIKKDKM